MPITIPVPDARWRSSISDRIRRGRDWPEYRHADGLAETFAAMHGRLGLTIWVCAVLVAMSEAGWLTAFLSALANLAGFAWVFWVGARLTAMFARRRYVIRRAWRAGSVVDAALRARGLTVDR